MGQLDQIEQERLRRRVTALEVISFTPNDLVQAGGTYSITTAHTRWAVGQFPDASNSRASASVLIPARWTQVTARVWWTTGATTGVSENVLQVGNYADGDDPAASTAYNSGTQNWSPNGTADYVNEDTITGVTVTPGELHLVSLIRNAAEVGDTLTSHQNILGLALERTG